MGDGAHHTDNRPEAGASASAMAASAGVDRRSWLKAAFFAVPVFAIGGAMLGHRGTGARGGAGAVTSKGVRVVVARGRGEVEELLPRLVSVPKAIDVEVPTVDRFQIRNDHVRVFLVRDDAGSYSALSAVCPHAGCVVDYQGKLRTYQCPCHKASFAADGKRIDGPTPRDLDPLELEVSDDEVAVTIRRFRLNVANREEI